jgi:hypothetical protein
MRQSKQAGHILLVKDRDQGGNSVKNSPSDHILRGMDRDQKDNHDMKDEH